MVSSMTRLCLMCFAQVFACKTIVFDTKHKTRVKVDREVDILKTLNHPNIVRYGDVHWGAQETKIYMQFCREESLGKLVE
jgi:serine/threonine protein kinase